MTQSRAGAVTFSAKQLNRRIYTNLGRVYRFELFGDSGPWGPETHIIVKNLSDGLIVMTRDQNADVYLA